jgi:hypothetical protein
MAQKSRDSILLIIGARVQASSSSRRGLPSDDVDCEGDTADVFVYTGPRGEGVPDDVVRVRVDPSVTSIPISSFEERKKLAEVELCEGLVEIRGYSFAYCYHSITKINIPISLRRINHCAFHSSLRTPIRLHDGIESIEAYAFCGCIFTNYRVPPLITVIPNGILYKCTTMFSLELPHSVTEINEGAFYQCFCLRNVAFPPNADVHIFGGRGEFERNEYDLFQLFGSIEEMINELWHRFDILPIHKLVYYQSYHEGVLQNLIAVINLRSGHHRTSRSHVDPTGNQQDCLGMTPLHILTCSLVHDLEVYRLIVTNYPANLITEDRWGALPLLYAFWGAAPAEIIQFLLKSYQSLYPGYVFNWTMMLETMGRCDTPMESIENLLSVKQMHFPDQPIDWEYLLDEFASNSNVSFSTLFSERVKFLVMCGMSESVEALAFKVWRDHIIDMVHSAEFKYNYLSSNQAILDTIQAKVAHFEEELPKLKEITSILELALWKSRMNASLFQKKIKTDESSIRNEYRITCGADVIIRHMLPYLIAVGDEQSNS